MIGSTLARAARPVAARQQRRGIVNWMTNYPDKVRGRHKFSTEERGVEEIAGIASNNIDLKEATAA